MSWFYYCGTHATLLALMNTVSKIRTKLLRFPPHSLLCFAAVVVRNQYCVLDLLRLICSNAMKDSIFTWRLVEAHSESFINVRLVTLNIIYLEEHYECVTPYFLH